MSHITKSGANGGSRARLTLAAGDSFESSRISLFEAVDALAKQLLAQGWSVRMPRTPWDCEVGVLTVSSRAFSSTGAVVHLDARRQLTLTLPGGEQLPASDVGDLTRKLRCAAAEYAARSFEPVPAA
jgi:hypothetical protein